MCIKTGWIVAYHGPFPCGTWPDLKIFRSLLKPCLRLGERVVADRGYQGDHRICHPDSESEEQRRKMSVARARHETVNGRLKNWHSLTECFRHSKEKHHMVLRAVLVVEQIKIMTGKVPFQVDEVVDPMIAWD